MKSKEEIAKVLKNFRQKTGLSGYKVVEKLNLYGIKVSPKTLYGWENGHSQPDAGTLLLLCDIYGIDDIMRAFGYGKTDKNPAETKTPEKDKLLNEIEQLDENTCKVISSYIDGLLTKPKGRGGNSN